MKKKIIMALVITPLLVCCSNGKTTDELKAEYIKKEQEEKLVRQQEEKIKSGRWSYEEAMHRLHQKIKIKEDFSDTFRFYDKGHFYKGFYHAETIYLGKIYRTFCIVHDPDCPCVKK